MLCVLTKIFAANQSKDEEVAFMCMFSINTYCHKEKAEDIKSSMRDEFTSSILVSLICQALKSCTSLRCFKENNLKYHAKSIISKLKRTLT